MPKPYIIKKNRRICILRKKILVGLKKYIKKNKQFIKKNKQSIFLKKNLIQKNLNKKYKRLIVNLMFTKTYSNIFLTAVNNRGGVLAMRSTGLCGLHTKKKKRS
jgi:hypothetical protein